MDGDWNDATAIAAALKGVEGAFVMLPAVWAPSPDYKEARGVIANYVEALTTAAPPRVVALSSMRGLARSALGDEGVKRLMTIPGVDMVVALAIVAAIGEA